jgi:hypothetical protein
VRHTSAEVLKFYKKVLVGATHAAIR